MLINNRPDGSPAKVPGFTKIMPYLMPTRTESTIYFQQTIELDKTILFMKEWNDAKGEEDWPLTLMQICLNAIARAVAQRPRINRFVSNQRHYQRNNISISFVTKKNLSDDGVETNVIMPFRPFDTLNDVNERFKHFVGGAKSDDGNKAEGDVELFEKLPHWSLRAFMNFYRWLDKHNWLGKGMMRMMPFYATVFLTNVGSIGLDAPIHHNFELGNTGIFAAIGKIRGDKELQDDGSVVSRVRVNINYSFDDRIVDGIYSGRAMGLVKEYIENPVKLLEKPNIAAEHLEELALTEKGFDLWDKA